MKYVAVLSQTLVLSLSVFANSPSRTHYVEKKDSVLINVIEGTVFDPNHQPVPDLWIELQNEFNLNLIRIRSNGTGRFTFSGIGSGRYYIKVYTTGTNFEEQTVGVEVINVIQNASDTVYQDIYLKYRKAMGNVGIYQATAAIFAQEVPAEARRLFNQGTKDLNSNDIKVVQRGREELDQAINLFPDYYDALNAIGCNYVAVKEYQKSVPYLVHAIDINQRSFTSFYSLGYAAYKLGQHNEASEAARAATILEPNSVNAQLLYGTVLRLTGNLDKALVTLQKAEKLSKDSPVAEVYWQLALLLNRLNRNTEAADALEKYLKIDPDVADKKQVQELIQKLRNKPTGTQTKT